MKLFTWFFLLLTAAQLVFAITWFLLVNQVDRVIMISSLIYAAMMIIGLIANEVDKYRRRKKQLLDQLP